MNNFTNTFSEKPAQPRIKKTIFSQMIRNRRIQLFQSNPKKSNKNHCGVCGFHIRSVNHLEGSHHYNSLGAVEERRLAATK